MTRELTIEQGWREGVASEGGIVLKMRPGINGYPDRLVDYPMAPLFYIEFKKPGKKAEPHQKRRHHEIRLRGKWVFVIDVPFDRGILADMIFTVRNGPPRL